MTHLVDFLDSQPPHNLFLTIGNVVVQIWHFTTRLTFTGIYINSFLFPSCSSFFWCKLNHCYFWNRLNHNCVSSTLTTSTYFPNLRHSKVLRHQINRRPNKYFLHVYDSCALLIHRVIRHDHKQLFATAENHKNVNVNSTRSHRNRAR